MEDLRASFRSSGTSWRAWIRLTRSLSTVSYHIHIHSVRKILADRVGHKWLNVPYDCGLFYTKSAHALPGVFAPVEAPAYLTASSTSAGTAGPQDGQVIHEQVPSPLYVNIENSRRFRALPLLASLMSLGKDGYRGVSLLPLIRLIRLRAQI